MPTYEQLARDLAELRAAITVTRYRAALWCEAGRQAREHTRAMRLVAPMVPSRHTEKLARFEREIAKAEGGLERQRCLAEALAAEGDRTDAARAGVLAVVLRWAVEAMRDEAAELRRVLDQLPAR
jgi:hypothetical protein